MYKVQVTELHSKVVAYPEFWKDRGVLTGGLGGAVTPGSVLRQDLRDRLGVFTTCWD